MTELSLEKLMDNARNQESRIEELQEKIIQTGSPKIIQRDPVYDLYLNGEYLYLNIDLPGVLEQELHVVLKETEISVSGEFPRVVELNEVEFFQQLRAMGPFQYRFLLPDALTVQNYDWQLVNGVLQVRLTLVDRNQIGLLLE